MIVCSHSLNSRAVVFSVVQSVVLCPIQELAQVETQQEAVLPPAAVQPISILAYYTTVDARLPSTTGNCRMPS
jgi:hypothetical protein